MIKQNQKWLDDEFCILHWDYDNPHFAKLAHGFEPKSFVRALTKAQVKAVCFFAKDCFGYSLYNTKVGVRHPGLKFDLLRSVTDACRKANIKVIYYLVGMDQRIGEIYPDWVYQASPEDREKASRELVKRTGGEFGVLVRHASKEKDRIPIPWIRICLNSPYIEEYLVPAVIELCANYGPDGFFFDIFGQQTYSEPCYCRYCEEKFRRDFKQPLPKGIKYPFWFQYLSWYTGANIAFEKRIAGVIKGIIPEAVVMNNVFAVMERPFPPTEGMDALCRDPMESLGQNPIHVSAFSKFLVTQGRPFYLHTTRMLQWWYDWMLRPTESMQQDLATVIANGGGIFLGDKLPPECSLDPALMKEEGKVFAFANRRKPFLKGARPVPYIGILHTRSTYQRKAAISIASKWSADENLYPILGASRALTQSGMPHVIFTEDNLSEKLDGLQALVLSSQKYLSREVMDQVKSFVRAGGGLVATYDCGMFDVDGKSYLTSPLDEMLGVRRRFVEPEDDPLHYIVPAEKKMRKTVGSYPLMVRANAVDIGRSFAAAKIADFVPPVWRYVPGVQGPPGKNTGRTAIVSYRYGKGKVVYCTSDFLQVYYVRGNPGLRLLMKYLTDHVVRDKIIEVIAPPCVEVTLFQQGRRWIVHLINYHSEKVPVEAGPRGAFPIVYSEGTPPVYDIKLRMKTPFRVEKAMLQPDGKRLKFNRQDNNGVLLTVPRLHIHSMVVVE